jgi:hypothetical protein
MNLLFLEALMKEGEMPELASEIMAKRQNVDAYATFCDNVLALVIGKHVWRTRCGVEMISQFVSISDEAFALLLLENSWGVWKHLAEKKEEDATVVKARYTMNGAGTKKNHGWTKEGLMRFFELIEEVKNDRKEDHGKFERLYIKEKSEKIEMNGGRMKKRAYHDDDDELLKLMHYGMESV